MQHVEYQKGDVLVTRKNFYLVLEIVIRPGITPIYVIKNLQTKAEYRVTARVFKALRFKKATPKAAQALKTLYGQVKTEDSTN